MTNPKDNTPVLDVRNVSKIFNIPTPGFEREYIAAVDQVSLASAPEACPDRVAGWRERQRQDDVSPDDAGADPADPWPDSVPGQAGVRVEKGRVVGLPPQCPADFPGPFRDLQSFLPRRSGAGYDDQEF